MILFCGDAHERLDDGSYSPGGRLPTKLAGAGIEPLVSLTGCLMACVGMGRSAMTIRLYHKGSGFQARRWLSPKASRGGDRAFRRLERQRDRAGFGLPPGCTSLAALPSTRKRSDSAATAQRQRSDSASFISSRHSVALAMGSWGRPCLSGQYHRATIGFTERYLAKMILPNIPPGVNRGARMPPNILHEGAYAARRPQCAGEIGGSA